MGDPHGPGVADQLAPTISTLIAQTISALGLGGLPEFDEPQEFEPLEAQVLRDVKRLSEPILQRLSPRTIGARAVVQTLACSRSEAIADALGAVSEPTLDDLRGRILRHLLDPGEGPQDLRCFDPTGWGELGTWLATQDRVVRDAALGLLSHYLEAQDDGIVDEEREAQDTVATPTTAATTRRSSTA